MCVPKTAFDLRKPHPPHFNETETNPENTDYGVGTDPWSILVLLLGTVLLQVLRRAVGI